ncbi:MAG: PKD domain-containing protein [Saprospiraceae bacterium]|nr:PKD domain-containing protein [Saprospiraceae bacterium]
MKTLVAISGFLLSCTHMLAQTEALSPPRQVDFTVGSDGNEYRFHPVPPPLQQKAGAPEAFWTYYWEFGDGSFSFEESPSHVYQGAGDYHPILEATAHYDDGGKPKGKTNSVVADLGSKQPVELPTVFDSMRLPIRMKASRQARAQEALVCILSYRNLGMVTTDGRLHFFFNEKRFPVSHFALDSARLHFEERADDAVSQALPMDDSPTQRWTVLDLPSHTGVSTALSGDYPASTILQNLLDNARGAYREEKIWRFTRLQTGEKRNLFIALQGTDKMLQDTNAFIHLEAVFAPFDPLIPPERYELEFEIVSSHDPNAILVSDSRVNYRLIGSKKLDYKVQFQNNGEGPASMVELKIEIPEGLDMKQMRPVEWYPKCPICPKPVPTTGCLDTASSKEGLLFTFRNIYLPGSRQKDADNRDSTQGFVRYRMEAERGMPKRSFRSRAKITFDKNAPIYTNYTRTRFKTGISPGLKVGYGFEPNFGTAEEIENESFVQEGYVFLGASLSPFKSWSVYPQVELLTGIRGRGNPEETTFTQTKTFPVANPSPLIEAFKDTVMMDSIVEIMRGFVSFEVPFLLRKNFTPWFGMGIGGSARVFLDNGQTNTLISTDSIRYSVKDNSAGFLEVVRDISHEETEKTPTTFSDTRFSYTAFADLTLGSVRQGINFGVRAGAILGRKKTLVPFAQLSLELKL